MLVDTHCHIYKSYYEDIDEVIKRAREVGINKLINNGCDARSNAEILSLVLKYEGMYAAIGIHPSEADSYEPADLDFIEKNLSNDKVVAIGEIGLDYYWVKNNRERQIELFEHQLRLAEKYEFPVIVHNRDATFDVIDILRKYNVKGVIHSFSGSYETAKELVDMGYFLGINGVVTFKNSKLGEVLKKIGLENLILETDSPYLTPHPFRGEKNDPAKVKVIAEYLADLFHKNIVEIEKITNENVVRIFDI